MELSYRVESSLWLVDSNPRIMSIFTPQLLLTKCIVMNLHQPANTYGFFAYAIFPENEDEFQPSTEEATITMIDGIWDHSWCSILQVR